jgi:hypothetical protein
MQPAGWAGHIYWSAQAILDTLPYSVGLKLEAMSLSSTSQHHHKPLSISLLTLTLQTPTLSLPPDCYNPTTQTNQPHSAVSQLDT